MKKHLVISGKVQGVGFRFWMQRSANEKNICGWVKNETSGNVEALIVGQEKDIQELIKLCKIGPRSAKINHVQVNDYINDYTKKSFDIIKTN